MNQFDSDKDLSLSDEISSLLAGDPELIDRVRGWVRLSLTTYHDVLGGDLEDLEQETLLDLTRALREQRFKGKCSLRTFVRSVAHHKAIDRLRARSRRKFLDIEDLDLPETGRSPLDEVAGAEDIAIALRVQQEMPSNCRELWRRLQEGLSYREMSRHFGVTEATLRLRVFRCRQRALKKRAEILARPRAKKR